MELRGDDLWWLPSSELERLRTLRPVRFHPESSQSAAPAPNSAGSSATSVSPPVGSTSASSVLGKPTGFVLGRGLGFAGQVFGLYSTTRSCLVGIEDRRSLRSFPFLPSSLRRYLSQALQLDKSKGPTFRFYTDEDDAKSYVKRMKFEDMEVESVPLHLAYKFFKERPSLFSFIPAKKQVHLAKRVITEARGKGEAGKFEGVPIFTSKNLSILVVGPDSVRWFRPYFFKKEELDGVIRTSMEQHYQSLILNRRAQRHNQLSDLPPEMGEEDMDMLDSQDVQEFMEDMDELGPMLESMMAKAAQVYAQDALDKAIFGNKWCRKLVGIQPKFPISVDSFERQVLHGRTSDDSESPQPRKGNWFADKLGLLDSQQTRIEAPHLTVVAGIAGSTPDQVMKAATSAIEQAKDQNHSNTMPLENLFIADLGGPQIWSNP